MEIHNRSASGLFFIYFLLLLVIAPLIIIFKDALMGIFSFDFDPYEILIDPRNVKLLIRSFALSAAVTLSVTIIAFPIAWIFNSLTFPFKRQIFSVLLVPFFISPYILAISWLYTFGGDGIFGFLRFGSFITGFGGSLLVLTHWLFPVMFFFIYNALRTGKSFNDAAVLYRKFWPRLWVLSLLLGKKGIFTGQVLVFILVFINFSVPGVLQLNVFPTEIFSQFGAFYNQQQAAILSVPNLLLSIIFAVYMSHSFESQKRFAIPDPGPGEKRTTRLGVAGLYFLFFMLFVISIGIPVLSLIRRTETLAVFFQSFSETITQWGNTLLFSLGGTVAICLIALYIAAYKWNNPHSGRIPVVILLLPLFVSGGLYAIGLIQFWNLPGLNTLYGTPAIIILSYLRFLPIAYFVIASGLEKIPGHYEDIAALSKRSRMATFWSILFPQIKPGITGAFLITFIFCFTELDTAVLTYPPGMETIPVRIFSLLHYGTHNTVSALSLWQIFIIIVLALLVSRFITERWTK